MPLAPPGNVRSRRTPRHWPLSLPQGEGWPKAGVGAIEGRGGGFSHVADEGGEEASLYPREDGNNTASQSARAKFYASSQEQLTNT